MKPARVIIFAKAPQAGRAKTRLGRAIGAGRAARLYQAMLGHTIAEATSRAWALSIAIEPRDAARQWAHLWPKGAEIFPQGEGDLGARLRRAARGARGGPVLIIGSDAPALRKAHLQQGFRALCRADLVIGPAEDGGFWLIGFKRPELARDIFHQVRWSSAHTLADTLAEAPRDWRIARLATLKDVDEAEDLDALTLRSRKSRRPEAPTAPSVSACASVSEERAMERTRLARSAGP